VQLSSTLAYGHFTYVVTAPAWSPDGARFVAGDLAGNLCVFEQRDGQFVASARLHNPPAKMSSGRQIAGVAWPTPEHIVSVERSHVCQRRPADLTLSAVIEHYAGKYAASGGNGAWVVIEGESSGVVFDVPGLAKRAWALLGHHDFSGSQTTALAANPRGDLFAGCTDGGGEETAMGMPLEQGRPSTDIVDVNTQQTIARIPVLARSIAFDPWREQILLVSYDNKVSSYTYAGDFVRAFQPHTDGVRTVAVTERLVLTGSDGNGAVALWDAATLSLIATAPQAKYTSVDWIVPSPDGRRFLTKSLPADKDFPIRVWQISGG
jgi:WD40 repeat protein